MRLYGGIVNYRSDHFAFYGANNQDFIKLLADELEKNHTRILNVLEFELSEEIMVYTHETQQHLHSALGINNGPVWVRAGGAWGILHIAPPECFDDIQADRVAVHVFSQIVMYRINPQIPYWLMQGAAAYLAQWMEPGRLKKVINANYYDISNSVMSDISIDYETFKDKGGYELAYTIAEYIVNNYSYRCLTQFLKEPDNYTGIFNSTKEEFQSGWLEYLKVKYMKES
jgi:RNA polymerase sigma-70 factor (ECF subfamily)